MAREWCALRSPRRKCRSIFAELRKDDGEILLEGPISLQNHSSETWFRNVKLRSASERCRWHKNCSFPCMIRKLKSGEYRLYSRKVDPKTGKRKNLGTFETREGAGKARARGTIL